MDASTEQRQGRDTRCRIALLPCFGLQPRQVVVLQPLNPSGCSAETGQAEARRSIREADHYVYIPVDFAWNVRRVMEGIRSSPTVEIAQRNLIATWCHCLKAGIVLPLDQVGFRTFSQFEEDGILLYLFTVLVVRPVDGDISFFVFHLLHLYIQDLQMLWI